MAGHPRAVRRRRRARSRGEPGASGSGAGRGFRAPCRAGRHLGVSPCLGCLAPTPPEVRQQAALWPDETPRDLGGKTVVGPSPALPRVHLPSSAG